VRPMTEVVVQSTARQDFNMLLLTIFGASALILAAIGIYGLMAYRSSSAPRRSASAWLSEPTAPASVR